jgi:hypothetical protein
MEAYERMPERGSPLQEWLFDIRLSAATRGPLRSVSHPVPKSKYQVFRAALAYGLFDAEFYKARYGEDGEAAIEVSWLRYLAGGWRSGQYPSERFHAYRYERSVEGFVAGGDEPVLHALLLGMRRSETRRRILECLGSPLELSEIALVRKRLRLQAFDPGIFRGDVHVLIGAIGDQNGIELTWKGLVQGNLDICSLDGPFRERIEKVAEKLGSILTDIRRKYQGS